MRLLDREPPYPKEIGLETHPDHATRSRERPVIACCFRPRNRRATLLASIPWFLQDLGTYGIGIFTPTILAATIGHCERRTAAI